MNIAIGILLILFSILNSYYASNFKRINYIFGLLFYSFIPIIKQDKYVRFIGLINIILFTIYDIYIKLYNLVFLDIFIIVVFIYGIYINDVIKNKRIQNN